MWGTTTLKCDECQKEYNVYGWLPTTVRIYANDEGLLCCDQQVKLWQWKEGKQ